MGMALEFNFKYFVWRMIPSQQMSRIILNNYIYIYIYIYNISYITYLYKLPPTPHQDSFLHVQCCKAQVASLATDLRGQLGQLQFPKAYPRYFTASMLASESSWWRPSRLYRRPHSTVLPGPSYLGLAKVHKHALSHACWCTLARPKFYPYQYPEELLASSYCNAFYRQRVWVCEASNKTLQVKTKHYQIADNSTKTNVVSGVCSPASPLVSQKNALFHVHVLTNKLKVIWISTTSNIG